MTAMALPQKLTVTRQNVAICKRLGVKIDGKDMGQSVVAYDIAAGTAQLRDGEIMHGKIEPYWRIT